MTGTGSNIIIQDWVPESTADLEEMDELDLGVQIINQARGSLQEIDYAIVSGNLYVITYESESGSDLSWFPVVLLNRVYFYPEFPCVRITWQPCRQKKVNTLGPVRHFYDGRNEWTVHITEAPRVVVALARSAVMQMSGSCWNEAAWFDSLEIDLPEVKTGYQWTEKASRLETRRQSP